MKIKKIHVLSFFVISLLITGCSSQSFLFTAQKNTIGQEENDKLNELVDIYPITPSLLSDLNRQQKRLNEQKKRTSIFSSKENDFTSDTSGYHYNIGVGDVLSITVWEHPELTIPAGSYRSASESGRIVEVDGTIYYPYINNVKVAGKTVRQIREDVSRLLSRFIQSPQVDVNVAAFRSQKVQVLGQVNKAGTQYITNIPLTLLDAVNRAGGIAENADWNSVILTRNGLQKQLSLRMLLKDGDVSQNILLKDGDVVYVSNNDALKVFVMGEVNKPSVLKMDTSGMSLTEALSQAGDINRLTAEASGVFVIRAINELKQDRPVIQMKSVINKNAQNVLHKNDKVKNKKLAAIYQLNIKDATALFMGAEFQLKPNDIVYVTSTPVSRWNRVISQLVPTITGFHDSTETLRFIKNW